MQYVNIVMQPVLNDNNIYSFISTIAGTIPLFMTISWILSISTIVKNIVFEKEQRLKEFMKVQRSHASLHSVQYTLYIVHSTLYTVQCTLYTVQCTLFIIHCTLDRFVLNFFSQFYKPSHL